MSAKEEPQSEEWRTIEELKVPLLVGYSQCKLVFSEYMELMTHTTKILEFDQENFEALF